MTMNKRSRVSSASKPTFKGNSSVPSKENYCYKILKTYSLIADFEGTPTTENKVPRQNVPKPKKDETFGRWQMRVLGPSVTDVVLYMPVIPAPQTKISTLQNKSDAEHIEKVFKAFERKKNEQFTAKVKVFKAFEKTKKEQYKARVKKAVSDTERQYTSFPKETLKSLIEDYGDNLVDSLKDILNDFLNNAQADIDTEELLRELLGRHNNAVRSYRQLEQKVRDNGYDVA